VDDAVVLAPKIGEYKEKHNLETIMTDGGFVSEKTRVNYFLIQNNNLCKKMFIFDSCNKINQKLVNSIF
jgi:hypothetical protein